MAWASRRSPMHQRKENKMDKVYILMEDYADDSMCDTGVVILGVYYDRKLAEDQLEIEAKRIRENYKDADIEEVKGDYIDGYVEGEYLWTHDNVYIEEQEIKLDKE